MDIFLVDERKRLYLSPRIDDWQCLADHGISVVIDLDGDLDPGVPTAPNQMLYVYFPIYDEGLPDLAKLHAVAKLGASLVESGHVVLSHCGAGYNRSALVAGLILCYLGMKGEEAVKLLRARRTGALFNDIFARHIESFRPGRESA
ncbi:MAG TPA: dual specificity protein phosphatase family protein [Thermoanaerobaculia bacterium]|nr:dual specificity protein phosphatase family protein [Thermoanaerobaculia bacterium]